MSEPEFENWLRLLGRFLKLSEPQRENVRRELRDHLETQLAEWMGRGFSREEALARALDEFGDAAVMAHELSRFQVRRKWIMRSTIGLATAAALAAIVSVFLPVGTEPARQAVGQSTTETEQVSESSIETSLPPEPEATLRTREQLNRPLQDLELDDISFEHVLSYLRESTELNIWANWRALEEAKVGRETAISLQLRNVSLLKALELLLHTVSGDEQTLGFDVHDGVIVITTKSELQPPAYVLVYDVQSLLHPVLSSAQKIVLRDQIEQIMEIQGHTKTVPVDVESAFEPISETIADLLEARRADDLLDVIRATIAPDTWRENGGDIGSIRHLNGQLVVTQSREAHKQLIDLLKNLKRARSAKADATGKS